MHLRNNDLHFESVMFRLILFINIVFTTNALANTPSTLALLEELRSKIETAQLGQVTGVKISNIHTGKTYLEAYAPNIDDDQSHDIRSATKGVTALIIGTLVDSKKLSVSQSVGEFFTDKNWPDTINQLTINQLLTMRSGLACNDWVNASVGHEDKMYQTENWLSFWSKIPKAYEPGQHFSYCTGNVIALGALISHVAKVPLPEYAKQVIFNKLSIKTARWQLTPSGLADSGGHLKLTLSDFHKIGILVANKGVWHGNRLVSAEWIAKMTQPHTSIYERPEKYGYLWWRYTYSEREDSIEVIYAHGNGGNFTFIIDSLDLVVTFTGKAYGTAQQFIPFRFLLNKIIPQFKHTHLNKDQYSKAG